MQDYLANHKNSIPIVFGSIPYEQGIQNHTTKSSLSRSIDLRLVVPSSLWVVAKASQVVAKASHHSDWELRMMYPHHSDWELRMMHPGSDCYPYPCKRCPLE